MKKDKLDIIYQDKSIIVINKPTNLLTISTNNEKEKTLFHKVLTYEHQKHKANKVFVVHRLDRETSGIIIFAKDEKTKRILQDNWDKDNVKRGYVAIVEGRVKEDKNTIKSYLRETKELKVYSTTNPKDSKLAITKYQKIKTAKNFTMLKIEILTGRKNQIRVQLADIKHPIIGDKKYGSKTNPIRRMGLHANYLEITHPLTNKKITFEANLPRVFNDIKWEDSNEK